MIEIYGASDDLVEIAGDIREEFSFFPDDDADDRLLAFSDGTLLRVFYDKDGIWRLTLLNKGLASFEKIEGSVVDDTNDKVILSDYKIRWVVFGIDKAMG